jgi:hypothetical protein
MLVCRCEDFFNFMVNEIVGFGDLNFRFHS